MPNLKIFLYFFIAAIAGTLLHECGHALAAMYFGFHPQVHYAYCDFSTPEEWQMVLDGKKAYDMYPHSIWITLGGPIQTILTGTVGLLGVWVQSRRTVVDSWNSKHLFWIALTYFYSRGVFNSVFLIMRIYNGNLKSRSDETKLFRYWEIDLLTGNWVMLIVSCAILAYATFVLVKKHRLQLIIFGALGSAAGGWFWLYFAGKWILP